MNTTVATTPYEDHREHVLRVLARRCGWLDAGEREAAFHDAYLVFLQKQRSGDLDTTAMNAPQLRAYLVQTAIHKALDEGKRAGRKRSQPLGETIEATVPDATRTPDEHAAASFESARVREIVAELPERQSAIVKLRYFFDRTPAEIQDFLSITERAYRRDLERATRTIADQFELVRDDRFCDTKRSVILAYVTGVAGPGRARRAREHLAGCPGCASWAAELRESARKVAALLPVPPAALDPHGLERFVGFADGGRQTLTDGFTAVKQQVAALATRLDPSTAAFASGTRPGAATAAIVGCLAVGGGAAGYCAIEGLPVPLKQAEAAPAHNRPRPKLSPAAAAAQAPVRVTSRARVAPAKRHRSAPKRKPRNRAGTSSPPAGADEFGFEALTRPAPAPAPPPAPPGEFDP
jgi:RNA polymerase sigma factor (sigma-70 family)